MGKNPDDTDGSKPDPVAKLFDDLLGESLGGQESFSLPGHEIIKELGAGGMGSVLLARDLSLDRLVAVKIMKPQLARVPGARERFLREAKALASVRSDYVVAIHHVGESHGHPYFAMEYLAGESLDQWLKRVEKLPISEAVGLAMDACRGLSSMHQKGFIHRDIKPANLWVEELEENRHRLKVLDFGLVRPTSGNEDTLTLSGDLLGTPAYMAPEQAAGLPADERSDVFGLGCVLYQMVTGKHPFRDLDDDTQIAPRKPWQAIPILELRADTPPRLAELITKMFERYPANRVASCKLVLKELNEIARQLEEKRTDSRRRAGIYIGLATAAVLGVGSMSFLPFNFGKPPQIPQKPNIPEKEKDLVLAFDSDIPTIREPASLDNWLKSRKKILKVAQQGGDFTDLDQAIESIKEGEAIEIVDAGPYPSRLYNENRTRNIGIFSRVHSMIDLPSLEKHPTVPPTKPGRFRFEGPFLGAGQELRLSGLNFRAAEFPEEAGEINLLNLFGDNVVVENCLVMYSDKQLDAFNDPPRVNSIVFRVTRPRPLFGVCRDCVLKGGLEFLDWESSKPAAESHALFERNLVMSSTQALYLTHTRSVQRIRHNVLLANEAGIGLNDRDASAVDCVLEIANNTVRCNWFVLLDDHIQNEAAKKVFFVNNLIVNEPEHGISGNTAEFGKINERWTRRNNNYLHQPEGSGNLALTPTEQVLKNQLKSLDPTSEDFAKLTDDAASRTGGAGGKYPTYVGAVSPVSDPDHDWLAKMRSRYVEAQKSPRIR